jgi:hypothetical protein
MRGAEPEAAHPAHELDLGLGVQLGRAAQVARAEPGVLVERHRGGGRRVGEVLARVVDEIARGEDERVDRAGRLRQLRESMADDDVVVPVLRPELRRLDRSLEGRRQVEDVLGPEPGER